MRTPGSSGRARCELEIEVDRTYLMGILQRGGPEMSVAAAARILNDQRASTARKIAIATGKDDDEADQWAQAARLSTETIRRDYEVVVRRVREAQSSVTAVFLDDQIAEVRRDIDSSYRVEEEIWNDIEASRSRSWKKTKVTRANGSPASSSVTTHDEPKAADASLYGVVLQSIRSREALRAELRMLKWGRSSIADDHAERTFAESLMEIDDPVAARHAALELYRREIRALYRTEGVEAIGSRALMQMDRVRTQRIANRARLVREYLPLIGDSGEKAGGFELILRKVEKEVKGVAE